MIAFGRRSGARAAARALAHVLIGGLLIACASTRLDGGARALAGADAGDGDAAPDASAGGGSGGSAGAGGTAATGGGGAAGSEPLDAAGDAGPPCDCTPEHPCPMPCSTWENGSESCAPAPAPEDMCAASDIEWTSYDPCGFIRHTVVVVSSPLAQLAIRRYYDPVTLQQTGWEHLGGTFETASECGGVIRDPSCQGAVAFRRCDLPPLISNPECAEGTSGYHPCGLPEREYGLTGCACPAPPCESGSCAVYEPCREHADCASGRCIQSAVATSEAGSCAVAPHCLDGIKSGTETDLDCGGLSCRKCPAGWACATTADCFRGECVGGRCVAGLCGDGLQNGLETDVDCGGPDCGPCRDGDTCAEPRDCWGWTICRDDLTCGWSPLCGNGVQDPGEMGVDCGFACRPCPVGELCADNTMCQSTLCCGASDTPEECSSRWGWSYYAPQDPPSRCVER